MSTRWPFYLKQLGLLVAIAGIITLARAMIHPELTRLPVDKAQRISMTEFKGWIESGKKFVLIDARDGLFYRDGHIASAKNIPRRGLGENEVKEKISPLAGVDESIVVYCSDRDCHDSVWMAEQFLKSGYLKVWVLDGGWADWTASGGEVSR